MLPVVEIYHSLDCFYAYLLNYRLRQVWEEFASRLTLSWRALSLEYINQTGVSRSTFDEERLLFAEIEPRLRARPWARPAWDWPVTMWPAFEALACAQAQNAAAAYEMSWALRTAFFAEGRNLALRHELLLVAAQVAKISPLDLDRFTLDWDTGRYKETVLAESQRGWHTLKLDGSATLVLPDGRAFTNPATHSPEGSDPLEELRSILASVG